MPTPSPLEHAVSQAEDGMKLTTFIERRLANPIPLSMLHKWIRSGQVRVNKKRAKPFQRLSQGDVIRIPPFAELRQQGDLRHTPCLPQKEDAGVPPEPHHPVSSEQTEQANLPEQAEQANLPKQARQAGLADERQELGRPENRTYHRSMEQEGAPYSQPKPSAICPSHQASDGMPDPVSSPVSNPISGSISGSISSIAGSMSSKSGPPSFDVIYQTPAVMVINKPSGLAVQPGSGLTDSVVERLRRMYAEYPFIPAPAHRLDKNTSGLLAIGLTHSGLAMLSKWFASPDHAHKHYLAWVHGDWDADGHTNSNGDGSTPRNDALKADVKDYGHGDLPTAPTALEDYLCKSETGRHNMERVAKEHPKGLYALSHVTKLRTIRYKGAHASLLRVALVTGRTHQIRAQLSTRGYPIMGDVRYGGPSHTPMLLHAYELALPMGMDEVIRCLPLWAKPFGITDQMIYSQSL